MAPLLNTLGLRLWSAAQALPDARGTRDAGLILAASLALLMVGACRVCARAASLWAAG